jgi:hypothetical protein
MIALKMDLNQDPTWDYVRGRKMTWLYCFDMAGFLPVEILVQPPSGLFQPLPFCWFWNLQIFNQCTL